MLAVATAASLSMSLTGELSGGPPATEALTSTYDVVVYGGTPSGVIAAVTAGRAGRRVLLIEPTAHVGGMLSNGLGWTDIGNPATLGGYTREFFSRVQAIEGTADGRFHFEAKAAERAFRQMLASTPRVTTVYRQRLAERGGVVRSAATITALRMVSGLLVRGRAFIDASYEGDVMAQAGVPYVVGRESRSTYGESLAGAQPARFAMSLPADVRPAFLTAAPGAPGSGDSRIQDSNYRVCFSSDPANQVPFPRPVGYDRAAYRMTVLYLEAQAAASGRPPMLSSILNLAPLAHHEFDVNNYGPVSSAIAGANWAYPRGSYATRARIEAWHRTYDQGLLYFLRNDPSSPPTVQAEIARYGLCRDEFVDSHNWPRQLYIREGRRMLGWYVLRQRDIELNVRKSTIIGVGSYRIDAHLVSRWADARGDLEFEGPIRLPRTNYAIPYRVMTPAPGSVANLLVSVTVSASHVALASLRMEPQYMIMGEAAGQAAALAVTTRGGRVRDISVAWLQSLLRGHGAYLRNPEPTAPALTLP